MRMGKFLASLGVPLFSKNDLIESLELVQQDLGDLLPLLEDASTTLTHELKSQPGSVWEKTYKQSRRTRTGVYWLQDAVPYHQNLQAILARLHDLCDKEFGKDIAVDGISYPKATLVQLVALSGSLVEHTRRLLSYLTAAEANLEAKAVSLGRERPPAEIQWLLVNRVGYLRLLRAFDIKAEDMSKAIAKIPEITFQPDTEIAQEATVGVSTIDPLQLNLVEIGQIDMVRWNLFFIIGTWSTSRKLAKLDRRRSDKKAIELRLEQLRQQKNNTPDAKLEKAIAVYEAELAKAAKKIAKLEGQAA